MKKIIFSIALMLFVSIAFADNSIAEKPKTATIENNSDKFVARFDLGNVTNLSESEINTLAENLIKGIKGGNRGGSAYPTEFLEEVVIRAKKSGVDAIWFKRQSDYGTGIINKEAFNFSENEEY